MGRGIKTHCTSCSALLTNENRIRRSYKRGRGVYFLNRCRSCYNKKQQEYRPNEDKEARRKAWKKHRNTQRDKVIEGLGGCCACCGESHRFFLTLDHVKNDGALHRKKLSLKNGRVAGSSSVYRAALKEGLPKDRYQLLCWNCNCAKAYYGICPHQLERGHVADYWQK